MNETNTHIHRNNFILLDSIFFDQSGSIQANVCYRQGPLFLLIESMAQLATMHVRYIKDFSIHAFLLQIKSFHYADMDFSLNGNFYFTAQLQAQSCSTFLYHITAHQESSEKKEAKGSFLISSIPYNDKFKKDVLENHYRTLFNHLLMSSPK